MKSSPLDCFFDDMLRLYLLLETGGTNHQESMQCNTNTHQEIKDRNQFKMEEPCTSSFQNTCMHHGSTCVSNTSGTDSSCSFNSISDSSTEQVSTSFESKSPTLQQEIPHACSFIEETGMIPKKKTNTKKDELTFVLVSATTIVENVKRKRGRPRKSILN